MPNEFQKANFLKLAKAYEDLKESTKEVKTKLNETMLEMGIGDHFQDESDGTVFRIVQPTGTFISFDRVGYERTKRDGEVKGSLSKTKAQELGYNV
jgi:hypothetical protein